MKLKIIAFNINTGGAKILLNLLIKPIAIKNIQTIIYIKNQKIIDRENTLSDCIQYKIIQNYWKGIFLLFKKQNNSLFFGNLPPFRKCRNSILYIHNLYLTLTPKEILKENLPIKSKLMIILRIIWIHLFHRNVTYIATQTNNVAEKLKLTLKRQVILLPFYEESTVTPVYINKIFDLCYVGLPSKHKNHELLLNAIYQLVNEGYKFTIALTIPINKENEYLLRTTAQINKVCPNCVTNLGILDKQGINKIYSQSKALIFPSKKETLGLPIIEALQHNLTILSSDLDFSHDLIHNSITFDPEDVLQIKKTIINFLKGNFNSIKQSIKIKSEIDTLIKLLQG